MPLTPEDVQNKRFTVVRFKSGYDEEEVDGFLDEIEAELRRLHGENTSLKQSAASAPAVPAAPPGPLVAPPPAAAPAPAAEDPNETALRTLLLAQRTADDAIAQAQGEAEAILTEARGRAGVLEAEAQATHRERVGALERERAELEAELTALRSFERDFRTRLKAYLQTQLGELDARGSVEPTPPARPVGAASPAPVAAAPAPPPAPVSAPAPAAPDSSPLAAAAAAAAASADDDTAQDRNAPAPAVPGLAPPAAAPLRPAEATTTPFSSAPTPGSAPFASRPAGGVPGGGIETDVDAASDAPSGPPTEAGDDPVDDEE